MKMKEKLHEKREKMLHATYDLIKAAYDEHRYPPSIREICVELGIGSTSTVHGYISELEDRGLLIVHHRTNRGLILTNTPWIDS